MKIRNLFNGLLITIGLLTMLNLLHAQEAATPVAGGTDSAVDWSSASDLQVMLEAAESLPTIPATAAPQAGTFYSAQHAPGSGSEWPPMPANIRGVPLWDMGGGVYLLDDLQVNYNQPVKSKSTAKTAGGMEAMDEDDGPPSPPGGDTNDDGGYTNNLQIAPIDTNGLWLQITNVSNCLAYLNLMNATDAVYEIWSKTNLLDAGWNIEGELWPTNSQTNVMPFTVAAGSPTNLFIWAEDWTGVTSGGNETPEWWFWKYFGTVDLSDTNLDSTGDYTLLVDYTYGYDPNVIQFSLQFTNNYVNASPVYGGIAISGGEPSYEAVLINDTNLADADWQPYSSTNVTLNLTSGNGLYNVLVGLKGLPGNATPTWVGTQLTLNTVAPVLTVTNPTSSTVSVPMIQLQGIVSESLSSLTFDVSNAAGIFTNQTGYCQPVFYDTNLLDFTTNTFQCYDIPLTNGVNEITLHATDVAGNTTVTNFSYTLSYAGVTNAPTLTVLWPTNNTPIGGSNVTIQAQVSDATATVTATVNGNAVQGLIERSGLVWLQNLPLNSGTNVVTITAANAAGKVSTNTLNIVESSVNLTIDPISDDQLNQSSVTVTGSVSSASYNVWVNGIEATVSGDPVWEATNVPVSATGTASLLVQVGTDLSHIIASQTLNQLQMARMALMSYSTHFFDAGGGSYGPSSGEEDDNWTFLTGGNEAGYYDHWPNQGYHVDPTWSTSFAAGDGGFDPNTVLSGVVEDFAWEDISYSAQWSSGHEEIHTKTHVMIEPPGQQAIGQSALYLVMAQVINEDTGLQLAAGAVRFMNQLAGTATEDVTNDDGSVWTEAVVSGAAGAQTEATPIAAGNISFNGMLVSNVTLKIFAATNGTAIDLSTNTPEFCVGQQVAFSNAFDRPISYSDSIAHWTLPDEFVNQQENYSGSCTNYYIRNDDLLQNTNTSCWFINGNGGTVGLNMNVILPNGHAASFAATGKIKVYRPSVQFQTNSAGPVQIESSGESSPPYVLASGGFSFHAIITMATNFSGNANWVQVIERYATGDYLGLNNLNTSYLGVFSFWLDNDPFYNTEGGEAGTPPVHTFLTSGTNTTVPFGTANAGDDPQIGCYPNYVSVSDSFKTYLVFNPGGNGIWVTLGEVTWGWTGSANVDEYGNATLIPSDSNILNPTYTNTDEFPVWSHIDTNSKQ
jgi:hypothetical protein